MDHTHYYHPQAGNVVPRPQVEPHPQAMPRPQAEPRPLPVVQDPVHSLPRTLSQANFETAQKYRAEIKQDWAAEAPHGGTNFFTTTPSYTLALPSLEKYPPDLRQLVFDRLIDNQTQIQLEEDKCLNWCGSTTRLVPIFTMGDGNCLLHAASLGMWGFQDRGNILRNAVSHAVLNHQGNTLYRRWKFARDVDNQQSGIQLDDHQWQEEWDLIVRQASTDVEQGANLDSLEEFHVFVLANILRRPIIMYASPKMRSAFGSTLQRQNFHGVYLPLLWDPTSCKKQPLPLAFNAGHFSALIVIESPEQFVDGSLVLPLTDYYGQQLPVRFAVPQEDPTSLLMDYLKLRQVEKHKSPYISRSSIICAELEIPEAPAYLKTLLNRFVEACTTAYNAIQQPQGQQPQGQQPQGQQRQRSNEKPYQPPPEFERNQLNQLDGPPKQRVPEYQNPAHQQQGGGDQPRYYDDQYQGQGKMQDQYRGEQPQNQEHYQQQDQNRFRDQRQQDPYPPQSQQQQQQQQQGYSPYQRDPHYQPQSARPHPQSPAPGDTTVPPQTGGGGGGGGEPCIEGCGRMGSPETSYMCEACFRQAQSAARTQEQSKQHSQPQQQQQQQQQPSPPNTGSLPQASGGPSLPGSIKCPHCTNPGHPMYLGMCQGCYRKRTTGGGGGGGGSTQPGKSSQIYESLSGYEPKDGVSLPRPPSQPALPLPRRASKEKSERSQCRMPGCEFFGTQETRFYCSQCFEENMETILKEVDNPNVPIAPNISPSSVPQQPGGAGRRGGGAPNDIINPVPYEEPINSGGGGGGEPAKCYVCHDFYGNVEYNGMCNECFLNTTKSGGPIRPQQNTTPHFGRVGGGGGGGGGGGLVQQTAPITTIPAHMKCRTPDCHSPRNDSGYCEKCLIGMNLPPPTTNFGAPSPEVQDVGFQRNHHGRSSQDYTAGNRGYAQTSVQNYPGNQPPDYSGRGMSTAPVQQGMSSMAISCFMCENSPLAATQSYSVCPKHAKQMKDLLTRELREPTRQGNASPPLAAHPQQGQAMKRKSPSVGSGDPYQGRMSPHHQQQQQQQQQQRYSPSSTQHQGGAVYGNEISETAYGGPSPSQQQQQQQLPPRGQKPSSNGQYSEYRNPSFSGSSGAAPNDFNSPPPPVPHRRPAGAVATPLAGTQGLKHQLPEEDEYVSMKPRQGYNDQREGRRDVDARGYREPQGRGSEFRSPQQQQQQQQQQHRNEIGEPYHEAEGGGGGGGGGGAGGFTAREELPKMKTLCRTAGCSFKGYFDLGGYCPDCYQGEGHGTPDPAKYPLV